MTSPFLLRVKDLSVQYHNQKSYSAVDCASFDVSPGESLGIIGESGSGKSTLALSIMGLLKKRATVGGEIFFKEEETLSWKEKDWNRYRWNRISLVFQNSLNVFNPLLTISEQISEPLIHHKRMSKREANGRTADVLAWAGLDKKWMDFYPHQISGGMRQKALIAMAIACEPELLLVDEPTMALDGPAKSEIIRLLLRLQREFQMSMIIISHELEIIQQTTTRTFVMYGGTLVEEGETNSLLHDPHHPYTRGLISASPGVHPFKDLWGIQGESNREEISGCPFYPRCTQSLPLCATVRPPLCEQEKGVKVACHRGGIITLLQGKDIVKVYKTKKQDVMACRNCDLSIKAGETVVLMGESGSGKSTLGEILSGLISPDQGEVTFLDKKLTRMEASKKKRGIQMVFQDPLSSTNEKLTVEEIIREPLDILKQDRKEERNKSVKRVLGLVQLPHDESFLKSHGYTLSGGQRQRVAIARALIMEPKVLIADEISSMLDPSTGANILRLLKGLQNREGFSMLYITHNLPLAKKVADVIYIMKEGRIVEKGPSAIVLSAPKAEYSKKIMKETPQIIQVF